MSSKMMIENRHTVSALQESSMQLYEKINVKVLEMGLCDESK